MTPLSYQSKKCCQRFLAKQDGAVTVDWVVLTAAVVGLALIVINFMTPTVFDAAGRVISTDVAAATARP
jgi:hypothetical protein